MSTPLCGVVEWLRGSTERFIYQANSQGGEIVFYRCEPEAAPVHYGCLPATLNPADNAEIDAIWLQEKSTLGQQRCEVPSGLLHLADGDHKVLFGELSDEALSRLLPWFAGRGVQALGPEAAYAFVYGNFVGELVGSSVQPAK